MEFEADSRAADATWVPVSEASDTAHTRVIHAGETSLQEYVIRPGEQVGDWFETDGEVIHYVLPRVDAPPIYSS